MNISDVLKKEHIITGLDVKNKKEALEALTDILYTCGKINDKNAFLRDVAEREKVSDTGIGGGIAIPHGKSEYVTETAVAVGKLKNPVEWNDTDGKSVGFIVLLAVNCNDKKDTHVRMLSDMARKLASEELCTKLMNAENEDEIFSAFSE